MSLRALIGLGRTPSNVSTAGWLTAELLELLTFARTPRSSTMALYFTGSRWSPSVVSATSISEPLTVSYSWEGVMSEPLQSFRSLLSRFPLESLERLQTMLSEERVIRGAYVDHQGSGCLLWALDHSIVSRDTRAAFFADDPLGHQCSNAVIAAWDNGTLTAPSLLLALTEAIAERREANAAEDETVRQAEAARGGAAQAAHVV